jgi:hypothetical protein
VRTVTRTVVERSESNGHGDHLAHQANIERQSPFDVCTDERLFDSMANGCSIVNQPTEQMSAEQMFD